MESGHQVDEKMAQVEACETPQEALEASEDEARDLAEEELSAVAGGNVDDDDDDEGSIYTMKKCPRCGSTNVEILSFIQGDVFYCRSCGYDC